MIQFKALFIKEMKEALRDKRAMMVAMMMALMAPVMIFAMSKFMISKATEKPVVYVKIMGGEYAPKLIKHFKEANLVSFDSVPEDKKDMWDERNITLTIPDTFAKDLSEGNVIDVIFSADHSDKAMLLPIRRIEKAVRAFSLSIGYKRLMVRGIDVKLLRPLNLIEQDTAQPNSSPLMIKMMLGMYLLMTAFMSGLPLAIDSSAGERERNVLEMLLCQPVDTLKIVLAKLSSASSIAVLGVVLTLTLTTVAVGFVDLAKIGATFSLDAYTITALLILLVPICVLASAMQLFFAFQSKSFKEAQSTVTMIIMIPAIMPMALMMMDDRPKWFDWTPILGQTLIIEDLLKGIPVGWGMIGFTGLVTLMMSGALVVATAKKLKSEKVVLALS
ncbi:MAG: ABC transporter permease subunit [Psychrosphaera sp.]|nr:ABC transporter permease subunit [Psychrosphaera sp.]